MNNLKRRVLCLFVLTLLLAIPTVAVLAKELGSLSVSGPGIKGEMTVNHEGGIRKLEDSGFFAQLAMVKPPENLGEPYHITAYLNLDGKSVPFVRMDYYPVSADQPGYVHYTGRLNGQSLQTVDEWGRLSKDADIAFRGLMEAYNVKLQSAVAEASAAAAPAAAPSVTPVPSQNPYLLPIFIIAGLILVGTILLIRRRNLPQHGA
jgi:hypothetical protein